MIRLSLGRRSPDGTLQSDLNRTLAVKFGREVFVSSDGGRTEPHSLGLRGGDGGNRMRSDGGARRGEWCNVLAVDPFDPAIILAGQQDLFKTTDGETTWRRISGDEDDKAPDGLGNPRRLVHEDFQDLCFDPQVPGVAYIACDGGVYVYNDGRVLDGADGDVDSECLGERNLGFATSEFFRVGIAGSQAVGNLDHNGLKGTTNVASGHWHHVPIGNNGFEFHFVYADPKRPGRFYTINLNEGGGQLKLLRFPASDGDDLIQYAPFVPYFSDVDPLDFTAQFSSLPAHPIAIDSRAGSNVMLVCAHRTRAEGFRLMMTAEADSDGSGGMPTWEVAFDNGDDPLVCVTFAPGTGTAYAMSANGRVLRKEDASAGAANDDWEVRGQWLQTDVRQLVVNATFSDRVYAISGTAFGRSTDGGSNWPTDGVSTPVGANELNSIAVDPTDPHTLFVGADTGVFVSHNQGATWSPYDDGLPNAEVMQVKVEGSYLYAVTHGRGLWRRRFC